MISTRNSPIGVIDSGIGGLSMLKELAKSHPTENYIYFADNAYMPYGSKSARSIKVRLLHLCNYLVNEFNVKLIILACHTASAVGLDYLTKQLNVPIFGLNLDKWTIGEYRIICTKLTNKYYLNSNAVACNNLAKEIEDNYFDASILNRKIMNIISKANITEPNIVLGCTHYELVAKKFKKLFPDKNFILPCKQFVKELNFVKTSSTSKGDVLMISTLPTKAYIDKLWKVFDG